MNAVVASQNPAALPIRRNTVLLVFGWFFLVLSLAAFALGRKGWRAHLGWLGPILVCRDGPVVDWELAGPLLSVREL